MSEEQMYPLTYLCEKHDPPLSKAAATEFANRDDQMAGACDAVVVISIVKPKAGGFSCLFVSRDGTKPEDDCVSPNDRFKAFCLWAAELSEDPGLSQTKRAFARLVFDTAMRGTIPALPRITVDG